MRKRVLIAGIFHETHTFLAGTTPLSDFDVRRGAALLKARGDGSPLGAALETAQTKNWHLVPTIDLRAMPSATVADEVVECFLQAIDTAVDSCGATIDGIFMLLHGAMVSVSHPDVEGEVLRHIRQDPRLAKVPIGGVLDLHGNISEAMADHSNALVAYRENPHTDGAATGRRAAEILDTLMMSECRATTVRLQPAIVWPPTGTGTAGDPMVTLERMARELEVRHAELRAVNVFAGFSFADTPDTGVSFTAVTLGDRHRAMAQLQRLNDWAIGHRQLGSVIEPSMESVLPNLKRDAEAATRGPILLVEPSDNIGGGAPGDGTGVLKSLLLHDVTDAVVVINDPESASQCHAHVTERASAGAIELTIGSKSGPLSGGAVALTVTVESTSDGRFELEDPQSHFASMGVQYVDMGPCAVVRHRGIRILLTSNKTPPFDLAQLRSQGIEPETAGIIGVKAAVAHRRAYDPIAAASYTVATPGTCSSDLRTFPYARIRRPIYPLDET